MTCPLCFNVLYNFHVACFLLPPLILAGTAIAEERTRFHLRRPWYRYIPVKLLGEGRAILNVWRLAGQEGPRLISNNPTPKVSLSNEC